MISREIDYKWSMVIIRRPDISLQTAEDPGLIASQEGTRDMKSDTADKNVDLRDPYTAHRI
jgi:hypothetical protein